MHGVHLLPRLRAANPSGLELGMRCSSILSSSDAACASAPCLHQRKQRQ